MKKNKREKNFLLPQRLILRSLRSKAINNVYYLSYFYYCNIFPNIRHGIIIKPLVVPKYAVSSVLIAGAIFLIHPEKIQAVMMIKVDRNKGICADVGGIFCMAVEMIMMSFH